MRIHLASLWSVTRTFPYLSFELQEGMRYNALHIATRGDKPLIVSKILSYLNGMFLFC